MLRAVIKGLIQEAKSGIAKNISSEFISSKQAERVFKFFHLSGNPNIRSLQPRNPGEDGVYMGNEGEPIEDFSTKRVSFAPSINDALRALGGRGFSYVYAVDVKNDPSDDIEVVNLIAQFPKCPASKNNPYGVNFHWSKYFGDPQDRPIGQLKKLLKKCVPDAKKTKEVWSLRPVRVIMLGEYTKGKIYLTPKAAKYLKSLGVKVTK